VGCILLSLPLRTVVLVVILYGPVWYILLYIYSLANYVSINYFFVLFTYGLGRVECSGFCVLLEIVLGCSLLCLCSLAGGGSSWRCCSVHLHCSGGSELVSFSAAGCMCYRMKTYSLSTADMQKEKDTIQQMLVINKYDPSIQEKIKKKKKLQKHE